jgi:hypothetical protein
MNSEVLLTVNGNSQTVLDCWSKSGENLPSKTGKYELQAA